MALITKNIFQADHHSRKPSSLSGLDFLINLDSSVFRFLVEHLQKGIEMLPLVYLRKIVVNDVETGRIFFIQTFLNLCK